MVNGKIYAIGGYNNDHDFLDTEEEYDPSTNQWQSQAPMPTPRGGLATVMVDGKIYAIGGSRTETIRGKPETTFSELEDILATVEEYNPPPLVTEITNELQTQKETETITKTVTEKESTPTSINGFEWTIVLLALPTILYVKKQRKD